MQKKERKGKKKRNAFSSAFNEIDGIKEKKKKSRLIRLIGGRKSNIQFSEWWESITALLGKNVENRNVWKRVGRYSSWQHLRYSSPETPLSDGDSIPATSNLPINSDISSSCSQGSLRKISSVKMTNFIMPWISQNSFDSLLYSLFVLSLLREYISRYYFFANLTFQAFSKFSGRFN